MLDVHNGTIRKKNKEIFIFCTFCGNMQREIYVNFLIDYIRQWYIFRQNLNGLFMQIIHTIMSILWYISTKTFFFIHIIWSSHTLPDYNKSLSTKGNESYFQSTFRICFPLLRTIISMVYASLCYLLLHICNR